jgi:hypothetical protein
MDAIQGVINSNNNISGVVDNTDTTYGANNNNNSIKRNLRSSVRKSKLSNGYHSTSPIVINDDSSVNEPINNNSGRMPNNLGTGLVYPLSSAIAFLTTSTSLIKAGGMSRAIAWSTPSSLQYTSAAKFIRHLTF